MRNFAILLAAGAAMSAASTAMAAGTSFATATVVDGSGIPSAAAYVNGALDASGNQAAVLGPETVFQTYTRQQRVAGMINSFPISGLSVGGVFRASMRQSTDPASGGLDPTWDSYLRVRNSANTTTLATDDDGGPGALSSMASSINVPADGQAIVQITGYSDRNTFTGADSTNVGFFDLDVLQRNVETPATYGINVQWWRFENLTPGEAFSAEAVFADFPGSFGGNDTVMAAFDSTNTFIGLDDDGAASPGNLSRLTGVIPADGVIYVAVTSYQGTPNAGQFVNENANIRTGPLTLQFIPAPGSLALLGLGGLVGLRRRRA